MRFNIVAKILGLIVGVVSLFMLWPLAWAYLDNSSEVGPIFSSMIIGIAISVILLFAGSNSTSTDMRPREALAIVGLSWLSISAIGALPFWLSGALPSYTDAFFEAVSGFTTTGSTVLTDIEANGRGILFWRSLTHWLGGMGIIVLGLAILPFLGVGGRQLFRAEVPGPVPEKLTPRIHHTALLLWGVYLFLSALEAFLLYVGGLSPFEALTHTFGTMATGGFSPLNGSVGQYNSLYVDSVVTIFMFMAGANFALHYRLLARRDLNAWWRDEEFRFYLIVILGAIATISLILYKNNIYDSVSKTIRYVSFQSVSIMTTTGFVTADYEQWPVYAQSLLLILMLIGGCAGSTGGGMKVVRLMILLKHVGIELKTLIHPRAHYSMRLNDKTVEWGIVLSVLAFLSLYVIVFVIAFLLLTLMGVDLITAIAAVAATLGNIGPGLGNVGPMDNFAELAMPVKWILSFCMLFGRLELYPMMALFLPDTWKR